ncbi:MAG: hypothetical protein HRF50_13675 [Phycisphaerae bacterium]|jgi:hypothetical protein
MQLKTARSGCALALAFVLIGLSHVAAPHALADVDLFAIRGAAATPAGLSDSSAARVVRSREVTADAAALRAAIRAGQRHFRAPLFDGDPLRAHVKRVRGLDNGGLAVSADVEGERFGKLTFVVRGDTFLASIQLPGRASFEVRPAGDALVLRQLELTEHSEPFCASHAPAELMPDVARGGPACPFRQSPLAGYSCDDGSTVDLMVVYTAAARDAAGGTPQIEAAIDLSVAIANDALLDSDVDVQIRVVRKALIDYAETGNYNIDLPRLTETNDGFLDSVHADRDVYGADLVSLWVSTLNAGGAAFQLFALGTDDDGRYGFSVIRQDYASTDLVAHELGHNFGCQHDRPNAPNAGFFNYSYGYREPGGAWRTTMAYPPSDSIFAFSNPDLTYNGPLGNPGPTGVPGDDPLTSCDNALTIRNTAWTLANFRPSTLAGQPARLYVHPDAPGGGDGASWATALNDAQDALCRAVRSRGAVTEVWVAAGAYRPDAGTDDRLVSFRLADGVTMYGGFAGNETSLAQRDPIANPTILSGDIGIVAGDADNSYHVLDGCDLGPTAVLDGFIIERGNADGAWPHAAGGGLRVICGGPMVRNCVFRDNHAIDGGALVCEQDADPHFSGCSFENNAAESSGGAAHHYLSAPSYTDCDFTGNSAVYGGAVRNYSSDATIAGCRFDGNTADSGGAAENVFGGGNAWTGCTFTANSADWAGAVSNYQSAPTFADCGFAVNVSVNGGGAVINGAGSLTQLTGCTFDGNTANFGGAIYNYNASDAELSGCDFVANVSAGDGGAIYNYAASPRVESCTFTQNDAQFGSGGAMESVVSGAPRVVDSSFTGNTAAYNGGAVVDAETSSGYLLCNFVGNHADYGGAVLVISSADPSFVNCGFFGNVAEWGGGAVENNGSTPTLTGCILSGNAATNSHGGALSNGNSGAALLVNCTLVRNTSGWVGGGIATDPPHPTLRNCIVWQNQDSAGAGEASQIYHWTAAPYTTLSYSTVQGWTGTFGGVGNNGSNPLLVDPDGADNVIGTSDDDPRPGAGSPCIDSGRNADVPTDALDADGDGNTAEPLPLDYSAEARFADDPAVADTGVGPPPIVDRGALESVPAACPGDIDGDGAIGLSDLSALLTNFGLSGAGLEGDIDADGNVDLADLSALLTVFGGACA